MKGCIQRKGNNYYAVIALNGKRKWFKGGPAKKDAQRVLNEKLSELSNGLYKDLPKATFEQFTAIWIRDYAEMSLKPSTKRSYKNIIGRFLPIFVKQSNERYYSRTSSELCIRQSKKS